jgi:hypothetical protein
MKLFITFLAVLMVASLVFAGPPLTGVYKSTLGQMLDGRYSESWNGPPFGNGNLGNTINSASWNNAALGTEWKVWCPSIAAPPTMVFDTRVGGWGIVRWDTNYEGGYLWLSQTGLWGNGEDYDGVVDFFRVTSDHIYENGILVGIDSGISMQGHFEDYSHCFAYSISNAEYLGNTSLLGKPADYPTFLDPVSCLDGSLTQGIWGDVHDTTFVIYSPSECTIDSEETTWGAVKALYQ